MREQEDFNLEEAGAVQLVQELQIAGLCCMVVLPQDYESGLQRYPVLYVNGEIPIIVEKSRCFAWFYNTVGETG